MTNAATIDSYQVFLNEFNIDKHEFYKWGISATIFSSASEASEAWEDLKYRVFNNQSVFIRGYGRDAHGTQLYKDLYEYLFGNKHVEKDPTNNSVPHKHIQKLTGLKRNSDILNYQVSHIWGRTKNVFMFEAPWNICYTPKIIDPFTGHETRGIWPEEYRNIFITHAYDRFQTYVNEYNQLLVEFDIVNRLNCYLQSLKGNIPEKEFAQFEKDTRSELSPVIL